jgi:uncharacterized membrane protein YgcG
MTFNTFARQYESLRFSVRYFIYINAFKYENKFKLHFLLFKQLFCKILSPVIGLICINIDFCTGTAQIIRPDLHHMTIFTGHSRVGGGYRRRGSRGGSNNRNSSMRGGGGGRGGGGSGRRGMIIDRSAGAGSGSGGRGSPRR